MATGRKWKKKTQALNMIGLGVAASALTFSLMVASPEKFLFDAQQMFASAVGAAASVPENADNTLARKLAEKEEILNRREASLMERDFGSKTVSSVRDAWVFMSFALSVLLLLLVGLNFYLDARRRGMRMPSRGLPINVR